MAAASFMQVKPETSNPISLEAMSSAGNVIARCRDLMEYIEAQRQSPRNSVTDKSAIYFLLLVIVLHANNQDHNVYFCILGLFRSAHHEKNFRSTTTSLWLSQKDSNCVTDKADMTYE